MDFPNADFKTLITLATKESFFLFDGEYYRQVDGVAMGSPLDPTLANAFLCFYEKQWIANCSDNCRPYFYRRYVDDIFFSSLEMVREFKKYMNYKHLNISFSFEKENGVFSLVSALKRALLSV